MKLLVIDTSTEKSIVAMSDGEEVLFLKHLPPGYQSSRHLFAVIEEGLLSTSLQIKDLNAIAVAVGPGSFTGIRVGVAAAKGLALGAALPLISLCSLSGYISKSEGKCASVIDARIGGAYVLLQEKINGEIHELTSPTLVSHEALNEFINTSNVVGPSFDRLKIPGALESYPDGAHLARRALNKFLNNDFSSDLKPVYLRDTV